MTEAGILATIVAASITGIGMIWAAINRICSWAQPLIESIISSVVNLIATLRENEEKQTGILKSQEKMLVTQGKMLETQGQILEQHGEMLQQQGQMMEHIVSIIHEGYPEKDKGQ